MSVFEKPSLSASPKASRGKPLPGRSDYNFSRPSTPSSVFEDDTRVPVDTKMAGLSSPGANGANGAAPPRPSRRPPSSSVSSTSTAVSGTPQPPPEVRPDSGKGPDKIDGLKVNWDKTHQVINSGVTGSMAAALKQRELMAGRIRALVKTVDEMKGQIVALEERNAQLDRDLQAWEAKRDLLDLLDEQIHGNSAILEQLVLESSRFDVSDLGID